MTNLTPANNVQTATVAGFIAVCVLHICAANNIIIPPDVADSLPGVMVIVVAYVHDLISGANAAKP